LSSAEYLLKERLKVLGASNWHSKINREKKMKTIGLRNIIFRKINCKICNICKCKVNQLAIAAVKMIHDNKWWNEFQVLSVYYNSDRG
jgi:hypothetical protein